jgi:hypothetical protein
MDCATMRSDVIGDLQEPYGAVFGGIVDIASNP